MLEAHYNLQYPNGDYLLFLATAEIADDLSDISMQCLDIVERGNIFDRQGSD